MSDITAAVKQYIVDTNIIGGRVYHDVAKQDAKSPFVVLEWDFGGSNITITNGPGVGSAVVEIFAYASSPDLAYSLAETIRLRQPDYPANNKPFWRYRGDLSGVTVLDITSPDGYERGSNPPTKGAPSGLWWVSRDYSIIYREGVSAATPAEVPPE